MRTLSAAIAILAVSAAGCGDRQEKKAEAPAKTPATKTPAAEATSPAATPTPSVAAHMKEHFTRVQAIRDAVVAGDYAATRAPSKWLAEHGAPTGVPDPWIPMVTDFRVMAGGLSDAKDLEEVAIALGPVARSCGGCHESLKAAVKYSLAAAPTGDGFKAEMARHKWAAGLLWDGVVIPSSEAWDAGAKHFASAQLVAEAKAKDKAARELAARAKALGDKAVLASDLLSRGVVYGELLATCADCHALGSK